MDDNRASAITIATKEYSLVLTTRATKEISKRYGGLENIGDKLLKAEDFALAIDEVVWLITLLANQSIMISNLTRPGKEEPLLREEDVELLTLPCDLAMYKDAIMDAMYKGTARYVKSEDNSKNTQAG